MKKILASLMFFWLMPFAAFADCDVVTTTASTPIASWGHTSSQRLGQSFVAGCSGTVDAVTFTASQVHGTPENASIGIWSDSSSNPGSDLGSDGTISVSGVNSYIATPSASVTSGSTYWVVFDSPGGYSGSNYFTSYGSGSGYGGNLSSGFNGSVWDTTYNGAIEVAVDVHISAGGGGGGTTTPEAVAAATSTVDQAEQNLYNGFAVFFISFFGMVYLMRRTH